MRGRVGGAGQGRRVALALMWLQGGRGVKSAIQGLPWVLDATLVGRGWKGRGAYKLSPSTIPSPSMVVSGLIRAPLLIPLGGEWRDGGDKDMECVGT